MPLKVPGLQSRDANSVHTNKLGVAWQPGKLHCLDSLRESRCPFGPAVKLDDSSVSKPLMTVIHSPKYVHNLQVREPCAPVSQALARWMG